MIIGGIPSPDEGPTTPGKFAKKTSPRNPVPVRPSVAPVPEQQNPKPIRPKQMRDLTMQEPDDATAPPKKYAKGGSVGASKRADGIAQRGKTKGKWC